MLTFVNKRLNFLLNNSLTSEEKLDRKFQFEYARPTRDLAKQLISSGGLIS